jgi:hypothetical protein
MTSLMLAAGAAVLAGLALAGGGWLYRGTLAGGGWLYRGTLAGVLPRGRARCSAALLAGSVLFTTGGLAVLARPAILRLVPRLRARAQPSSRPSPT